MDVRDIAKSVIALLEAVGHDEFKAIPFELSFLEGAKAAEPQEFQTLIDNLNQIISYYSQNPEGTTHNG